jgi:ATP-dependent DNA helicase DinG
VTAQHPKTATGPALVDTAETAESSTRTSGPSRVREVLDAAVAAMGGDQRPGQIAMAEAVASAFESRHHLLVQAGTGTGKSLGYLIPAVLHGKRVIIATATLALQHQLVERDLPAMLEAAKETLHTTPRYAVLKGRHNYACLQRVREGAPDDQGTLVDVPVGELGKQVLALRAWAEDEADAGGSGDRDSAPSHPEVAWRQVSVSARDCIGAARCPFGEECFAEQARDKAMAADIVVTNHALLAIDAIEGLPLLPDHDAVVVDEAHELAARVTGAASAELSPVLVERAAQRAARYVSGQEADDLEDAAALYKTAVDAAPPGQVTALDGTLADSIAQIRDAARSCWSVFPSGTADDDAGRKLARNQVDDVRAVAERMAVSSELDVLWVAERDRLRLGHELRIAPLTVAGLLRQQLFSRSTVVMTSATLSLGGDFDAVARAVGLRPSERVEVAVGKAPRDSNVGSTAYAGAQGDDVEQAGADPRGEDNTEADDSTAGESNGYVDPSLPQPWSGVDVGSPFDYARQGILYIAAHLPPPGRDGLGEAQLAEIAELVQAAGGRTLGLFSSRRAAEYASEQVKERIPELPILCQFDGQLALLKQQFVAEPQTSLFGTLSLWQGLDVPGDTCRLVIIDRIPFPRPDDPLMSARQRAVSSAGGNGFMAVAASHAALLLAQGSGRLIRTLTDRGVVAVLDPRLATQRYGSFLLRSMPPFWRTTDAVAVRAALGRLSSG